MTLSSWTAFLTSTATLTVLSQDFFNRREKVYADRNDAERYRKQANTNQKALSHSRLFTRLYLRVRLTRRGC